MSRRKVVEKEKCLRQNKYYLNQQRLLLGFHLSFNGKLHNSCLQTLSLFVDRMKLWFYGSHEAILELISQHSLCL